MTNVRTTLIAAALLCGASTASWAGGCASPPVANAACAQATIVTHQVAPKLHTLSGDITALAAVHITPTYEWRRVPITIAKASKSGTLFTLQPLTNLSVDGTTIAINSQTTVTYRGVSATKVSFKRVKLAAGAHTLIMRFDPNFDSNNTHTPRGAGIDVNGDGISAVFYSQDGVNFSEDVGVDLIYELAGK